MSTCLYTQRASKFRGEAGGTFLIPNSARPCVLRAGSLSLSADWGTLDREYRRQQAGDARDQHDHETKADRMEGFLDAVRPLRVRPNCLHPGASFTRR